MKKICLREHIGQNLQWAEGTESAEHQAVSSRKKTHSSKSYLPSQLLTTATVQRRLEMQTLAISIDCDQEFCKQKKTGLEAIAL